MTNVVELIESLRNKLGMFGVQPTANAANIFIDSEAVYEITTISESTLKKKHNSIASIPRFSRLRDFGNIEISKSCGWSGTTRFWEL